MLISNPKHKEIGILNLFRAWRFEIRVCFEGGRNDEAKRANRSAY